MKNEPGIALITVMFVFILTSTLVTAMLARQQLDMLRSANMIDQAQAYQYALGAEELARQVLAEDAKLTPDIDYPGQAWAQLSAGVPVERGTLSFALEDLQGRFNLNTLITTSAAPALHMQQLLSVLHLDPAILPAIQGQLGTEADPHPFITVQSLKGVEGITPEDYAALEPYITVLPEGEPLLNVNTASDTVLKAYLPDEDNLKLMLTRRAAHGYLTQADLNGIGMNTKGMTVKSHFFRLRAKAEVNHRVVSLTSVIYRDVDGAGVLHERIISRDFSKVF